MKLLLHVPVTSSCIFIVADLGHFGAPKPSQLMDYVGVTAKNKWREIGVHLGVAQADLDSFQMEEGNKIDAMQHCMRRVFQKWHEAMTSEYTWQKLVGVLESPGVNMKRAVLDLYWSLCEDSN